MAAVRPMSSGQKCRPVEGSGRNDYDQNLDINDTVVINVAGMRYEILKRTLASVPGTTLADLDKYPNYYRKDKKEYYFDRHPGVFNCVINYYRTKELHAPNDVCGPLYEKELEFWGIDPDKIQQCCWIRYNSDKAQRSSLDNLDYILERERKQKEIKDNGGSWTRIQMKVWPILDEPTSSKYALAFAIFSLLVSVASVITLCLETVPGVRQANLTDEHMAEYHGVETHQIPETSAEDSSSESGFSELTAPHPDIELIDQILMGYFVLELIVRFVFCPQKLRFFLDWMNVIDFLSLLPFFIELIVHAIHPEQKYQHNILDGLFILKILRILRIFRIIRHTKELKVLQHTFRASWKEILIMTSFIIIGIVLFGALIYLANHDETFTSIPKSFWWAIVTMTTVGYGDMYPTNDWGYFVGACCTITGVLVISFTVPSIVNNFLLFYNHVQYQREPKMASDAEHKNGAVEILESGSAASVIEVQELKSENHHNSKSNGATTHTAPHV